jgi:protein TonB
MAMMHVLMESGMRRRARSTRWTVTSVMMHAAIITAAVAATSGVDASPLGPEEKAPIIYFAATPPAVPLPASPPSGNPRIDVPAEPDFRLPDIPAYTIPTFDVTTHATRGLTSDLPSLSGTPIPASGTLVGGLGAVHTSAVVDRIVVALTENQRPDYPQSLRSASLEGEVLITFVVDTSGRVEPGSLRIVKSSHPLFAESVQRWLPKTRYRPAEIGGRRVRQLVQQQVGFALANER